MEEVLGMFQGVDKIYKDVRLHGTFVSRIFVDINHEVQNFYIL